MKSQLISLVLVVILAISLWPAIGEAQTPEEFNFSQYNDYQTVKGKLENLTTMYPQITDLIKLGQTFEGRDILAVRLTDNPGIEEIEETDVLIMGGHHGNELPSVEVPIYILEFLVENYFINSSVKQLVDSRDIWFVPLVNPDGRDYALNTDPNWRKNRNEIDLDDDGNPEAFGIDLNRNYDHLWGEQGTSADPNSNVYSGKEAFSENETTAIRNLATVQNFQISLSYHTFGEVIFYPWGNSIDTQHPQRETIEAIASELGERTGYTPTEGYTSYLTSGDSDDWLYAETECLPFTIELGDTYAIPESQILELSENNLDAALFAIDIAEEPEKALEPDWTFMVYMAADVDIGLANEAIVDLNEMEVVGSSQDINIIVLYDGRTNGDSKIYQIQTDSNGLDSVIISTVLDDSNEVIPASGEVDMSDYQVLNKFVSWTTSNFPARNNLLSIWGHGNGVIEGVSQDSGVLMMVDDIGQALNGFHLSIVGFDACSMGHFEVTAELAGIADIHIGSEALEPLAGWDYDKILTKLNLNSNMAPEELATHIINDYINGASETYLTQAAINVNVFQNKLIPLLNDFVNISLDFVYEDQKKIWITRNYTDTFVAQSDAVDLFEYLKNLRDINISMPVRERIQNLLAIEDELVIASGTGTEHPDSKTMAVYFPIMGASLPASYLGLDFSQSLWNEYLNAINNPIQKPIINTTGSIEVNTVSGPYEITASLSPTDYTSLDLRYRVNSGNWENIIMSSSGDLFLGSIPGQSNGSFIEYYFIQSDSNITEPYDVKWGSEVYLNFTVNAICDVSILEFAMTPETNLEEGNYTNFFVNFTNLGPEFTLINISLAIEKDNETLVLDWINGTIQPGEYQLLEYNWTLSQGDWNATAIIKSIGFLDINSDNNQKYLQFNVIPLIPLPNGNKTNDLALIFLVLILIGTLPFIALLMISKKNKNRRLVIAEKKIISTRSFLEMANEFGGDVSKSNIMLINAEMALKRGDAKESENWSRKAKDEAMVSVAEKDVN